MTYEERIEMRMAAYFADNHIARTQEAQDEYRLGVILAQAKNAVGAKLDRLYESLSFETEPLKRKALLLQMIPMAPDDVDLARELLSFEPDHGLALQKLLDLEVKESTALSEKEGIDFLHPDGHLFTCLPAHGYLRLLKAIAEEESDQGDEGNAIETGERMLTLDSTDALGEKEALRLLYLKTDDEEALARLATSFPNDENLIAFLVASSRDYLAKRTDATGFVSALRTRNLWFYLLLTKQIEFADPLRAYLAARPEAAPKTMEEALYAYAEVLNVYGEEAASFPCFPFYEDGAFVPIQSVLSSRENAILSLVYDLRKPVGIDEIAAILSGKKPPKKKSYLSLSGFGFDPALTAALVFETAASLKKNRFLDAGGAPDFYVASSCLGAYLHYLRKAVASLPYRP